MTAFYVVMCLAFIGHGFFFYGLTQECKDFSCKHCDSIHIAYIIQAVAVIVGAVYL